ncbi:Uncharacterized protein BN1090_A2_02711 [Aneurinibacillus migulanus]|nr:Uncharacterized protein BN1090_A2_02711 [Aneurinibacillus migulanus]
MRDIFFPLYFTLPYWKEDVPVCIKRTNSNIRLLYSLCGSYWGEYNEEH